MARLVVKNKYKKDTCYEEIGPCAQHMDTILGSIDDTSGDVYVIVNKKKRIFTLISHKCISTPILKGRCILNGYFFQLAHFF